MGASREAYAARRAQLLDELRSTHPRPLTNAQLAARCEISERTVQRHMKEAVADGEVHPVWVHHVPGRLRLRGWARGPETNGRV